MAMKYANVLLAPFLGSLLSMTSTTNTKSGNIPMTTRPSLDVEHGTSLQRESERIDADCDPTYLSNGGEIAGRNHCGRRHRQVVTFDPAGFQQRVDGYNSSDILGDEVPPGGGSTYGSDDAVAELLLIVHTTCSDITGFDDGIEMMVQKTMSDTTSLPNKRDNEATATAQLFIPAGSSLTFDLTLEVRSGVRPSSPAPNDVPFDGNCASHRPPPVNPIGSGENGNDAMKEGADTVEDTRPSSTTRFNSWLFSALEAKLNSIYHSYFTSPPTCPERRLTNENDEVVATKGRILPSASTEISREEVSISPFSCGRQHVLVLSFPTTKHVDEGYQVVFDDGEIITVQDPSLDDIPSPVRSAPTTVQYHSSASNLGPISTSSRWYRINMSGCVVETTDTAGVAGGKHPSHRSTVHIENVTSPWFRESQQMAEVELHVKVSPPPSPSSVEEVTVPSSSPSFSDASSPETIVFPMRKIEHYDTLYEELRAEHAFFETCTTVLVGLVAVVLALHVYAIHRLVSSASSHRARNRSKEERDDALQRQSRAVEFVVSCIQVLLNDGCWCNGLLQMIGRFGRRVRGFLLVGGMGNMERLSFSNCMSCALERISATRLGLFVTRNCNTTRLPQRLSESIHVLGSFDLRTVLRGTTLSGSTVQVVVETAAFVVIQALHFLFGCGVIKCYENIVSRVTLLKKKNEVESSHPFETLLVEGVQCHKNDRPGCCVVSSKGEMEFQKAMCDDSSDMSSLLCPSSSSSSPSRNTTPRKKLDFSLCIISGRDHSDKDIGSSTPQCSQHLKKPSPSAQFRHSWKDGMPVQESDVASSMHSEESSSSTRDVFSHDSGTLRSKGHELKRASSWGSQDEKSECSEPSNLSTRTNLQFSLQSTTPIPLQNKDSRTKSCGNAATDGPSEKALTSPPVTVTFDSNDQTASSFSGACEAHHHHCNNAYISSKASNVSNCASYEQEQPALVSPPLVHRRQAEHVSKKFSPATNIVSPMDRSQELPPGTGTEEASCAFPVPILQRAGNFFCDQECDEVTSVVGLEARRRTHDE